MRRNGSKSVHVRDPEGESGLRACYASLARLPRCVERGQGEQHCCERPDRSPGWIAARQDAEATRPGRLDRRIALKWFYRRASKWMLFWSAAGATFLSERHHSRSRAAWTYETYGELTCH